VIAQNIHTVWQQKSQKMAQQKQENNNTIANVVIKDF
jgi:hypothetical protein